MHTSAAKDVKTKQQPLHTNLLAREQTSKYLVIFVVFNALMYTISMSFNQLLNSILTEYGITNSKYHILIYLIYIIILIIIVVIMYKQILIRLQL